MAGHDADTAKLLRDARRLQWLIKLFFVAAALGAVFGIAAFILKQVDPDAVWIRDLNWAIPWFWVYGAALLALLGGTVRLYKQDPIAKLKQRLLAGVVQSYGAMTYQARPSGAALAAMLTDGLLPQFSEAEVADLIEGEYRNIPIIAANVGVVAGRSASGGQLKDSQHFGALVLKTPSPVFVNGSCGAYAGNTGLTSLRAAAGGDGTWERVKLESPDFEARFDVFGDSQIETRRFFTPARMTRWSAAFAELPQVSASVIIRGDELYCALEFDKGFLADLPLIQDDADFTASLAAARRDIEQLFRLIDLFGFDESVTDFAK